MRVLILSKEGHGAGIAHRLSKEGHHVDLWIEDKEYKDTLKGFVERPDSWRPVAALADLVISDCAGYNKYAEVFGRLGKPMLGLNPVGDVLDLDYTKFNEALNKVGVKTPAFTIFKTPQEAQSLPWEAEAGYVVHTGYNEVKVCETEGLYKWVLSTLPPKDTVLVTENLKTDNTVMVSIEGWFNGISWIEPFNYTVYTKGASITLPMDKISKLVKATTFRLAPLLSRSSYRGPISLKCVVSEGEVYTVGVRGGFNKKSIESLMTGLTEPIGAFLFDTATGIKKQMSLAKSTAGFDFLGSVRVCSEYDDNGKDMPICGMTDQDLKFTYFHNVYKDSPCIRFTGADEHIITATAFGRSVKEVQHRINKLTGNIKALDTYYKDNLSPLDRDIELLKEWSWL